jgi:hypothetical protein
MAKRRQPKTLSLRFQADPAAAKVYQAFRGTAWKHKPRNPDKSAWMRERGYDPDKAYASV